MVITQRWQNADKTQVLKWTVYSLLLLNFGYYAVEETYIASHTLRNGGSWLDWTEAFATTIDELGWFGLLFMFELETYILEDEAWESRRTLWMIHGVRILCYMMLAHTVLARVTTVIDVESVVHAQEVTSLCQVADGETSWGENYRYELLTPENCGSLSSDTHFYYLEPTVITDTDGFELEQKHAWVDLSDAVFWLLVVWAIELAVFLQNRGIVGGPLMTVSHAGRVFYVILFGHATWWAYTGHYIYTWDQTLWICGFWAIENNLSEWREEIEAEAELQA